MGAITSARSAPLDAGQPSGRPSLVTSAIIVSGAILSTLIPMAIIPAMPEMSRTIATGANGELLAQLVTTLPAAVMAISSPFTGWAVRSFGFRPYLIACLMLYVCAGLGGLIASDMATLIISRLLLGLAGGGVAALPFALAGNFPPAVRDKLIGFAGSAGGIAGIVALNAGGALVEIWGWRGPFLLYALGLVILFCALVDRTTPHASPDMPVAASGSILSILHLYLLLFLLAVGFYVPGLFGPFLLENAGMTNAMDQGFILSLFAVSSIVSAMAFGFLVRFTGTMGAAALAALFLAGGMAVMAGLQTLPMIGLGFVLAGVGAGLAAPAVISEILTRAPTEARAKAMGLKVTAIFLAQFMTPLILYPIQTYFGLPAAILTMSGLLLATALWALLLRRRASQS